MLPALLGGVRTSDSGVQNLYASATRDDKAGEIIVKAVNPGAVAEAVEIKLGGLSWVGSEGKAFTLSGKLNDVNSMDEPARISPVESKLENAGENFKYTFPARSMTVLRIRVRLSLIHI